VAAVAATGHLKVTASYTNAISNLATPVISADSRQ